MADSHIHPVLSDNAVKVLQSRYLIRDVQGRCIETPTQLFGRVASLIAGAEAKYGAGSGEIKRWHKKYYDLMASLKFLPNSPALMNAGRRGMLSACFVLPIEDSIEGIFEAVKQTALIQQAGGGTGFSFDKLRPTGDRVASSGGTTSGPISFWRVFSETTNAIQQGAFRRGANMGMMSVEHPDILKFLYAKQNLEAFTNFNISVKITDSWMKKVLKSGKTLHIVKNPRTGKKYLLPRRIDIANYTISDLHKLSGKGKPVSRGGGRFYTVSDIWKMIVKCAHKTGEPGVAFIDRINRDNPTPNLGAIESTNPCGEQPLLPYESCNLGSLNLSRMVGNGKPAIDYKKLAETLEIAVRFLDNVIDKNGFPIPEIEEMTKKTRKIGLGVMGFADMLIKLGIPYDSEDAIKVAEDVMRFINEKASEASVALAEERGVFPAFEASVYDVPGGLRVRNATITTIAPTGTLSIIAGCSSGIEPLFALSYVRNILDGDELVEVNPHFEEVARREGFYSKDLMRELARKGSAHGMEGIPEWVQEAFVTAHDISPEWHIRMQAAFQRSTHNAVSKTINFAHSATREDVSRAYMLAYTEGCKGITIYRDRSKDRQVLNIAEGKKVDTLIPRRRARTTSGVTEKVATGCGNIYVTVNSDEHGVCEVFSSLGKAGGCASAQLEAICRLISLALRSGVDVTSVVKHLRGIRCPAIAWEQGHAVLSCPDAIGSVLERHIKGESLNNPDRYGATMNLGGQCPECGGMLVYQEGCHNCPACGYTKCS